MKKSLWRLMITSGTFWHRRQKRFARGLFGGIALTYFLFIVDNPAYGGTLFFDDFEKDLAKWTNSAAMRLTNGTAFQGTNSLTFTSISSSSQGLSDYVGVQPGGIYYLYVAYMTKGGGGLVGVDLFDLNYQSVGSAWLIGDGSTNSLSVWDYSTTNQDGSVLGVWKQYSQRYVVPLGVLFIKIKVWDRPGGLPDDVLNKPVFFDNLEWTTFSIPPGQRPNESPVALDDSFTIKENEQLRIAKGELTANDSPGPDESGFQTVSVVDFNGDTVQGGKVTLENQTLIYTPRTNFFGEDQFTYTIEDNGYDSGLPAPKRATAKVQIVVTRVNLAPVVSLLAPTNNTTVMAGVDIPLQAEASDPDSDGSVQRVEFWDGPQKIGESRTSPFRFVWKGASVGVHQLFARAFDDQGTSADSGIIPLKVDWQLVLEKPTAGSVLCPGSPVTVRASAILPGDSLGSIRILVDGKVIAEGSSNPFEGVWIAESAGVHTVAAIATDGKGETRTASGSVVRVQERCIQWMSVASGFQNISQPISINNAGLVAFSASDGVGRNIYVGDGNGAPVSTRTGSDLRAGFYTQINDENRVVTVRGPYFSFTPEWCTFYDPFFGCLGRVPPMSDSYSFLQTWKADGTGDLYTAAQAWLHTVDFVPSKIGPFSHFGSQTTINNLGLTAFIADTSISFNSIYVLATEVTDEFTSLAAWGGAQPMISDQGTIVLRTGADASSPISLYDYNLRLKRVIAHSDWGFSNMGRAPGISDDGSWVAFVANLDTNGAVRIGTNAGPGIFLCETASGATKKIVGLAQGNTPVFQSFDLAWRVGVNTLTDGSGRVMLVYQGTDAQGSAGVFASWYNPSSGFVENPVPLLQSGDFGSTEFALYDPVNTKGEVAVWINAGGSQLVVKSSEIKCDHSILSISANATPAFAGPAEPLELTLTVRNTGFCEATGGEVSVSWKNIPSNIQVKSASSGSTFDASASVWHIDSIPGSDVATLVLSCLMPVTGNLEGKAQLTKSTPADTSPTDNVAALYTGAFASLKVQVVGKDTRGRPLGSLGGAAVSVDTVVKGATSSDGTLLLEKLTPGEHKLGIAKDQYNPKEESFSLTPGETGAQVFELSAKPPPGRPTISDFKSLHGKYLIEKMPTDYEFSFMIDWNGPPGSANVNVNGQKYPVSLSALGNERATGVFVAPAPGGIAVCSEVSVEVTNGDGLTTSYPAGVFLEPIPAITPLWVGFIPDGYVSSGRILTYSHKFSTPPWIKVELGKNGLKFDSSMEIETKVSFDPDNGVYGLSSSAGLGTKNALSFGDAKVDGGFSLSFVGDAHWQYGGCDIIDEAKKWGVSLNGEGGFSIPIIELLGMIPQAAPAVAMIEGNIITRQIANIFRSGLAASFNIGVNAVFDKSENPTCFLGTASKIQSDVSLAVQVRPLIVDLDWIQAKAGVFSEFQIGNWEMDVCPEFTTKSLSLSGSYGWFIELHDWKAEGKGPGTLSWPPTAGLANNLDAPGIIPSRPFTWEPIGDSYLRWGPANAAPSVLKPGKPALAKSGIEGQGILLSNVVVSANPGLAGSGSLSVITYTLHDPNKTGYGASDIGFGILNGSSVHFGRLTDDDVADFDARAALVSTNQALIAWVSVRGDTSNLTGPEGAFPLMEVSACFLDLNTAQASAAMRLTSNNVVDRDPLPIRFGAEIGILWIENDRDPIGGPNNADRLLYARWNGSQWDNPVTLWSGGAVGRIAFVADKDSQGHIVFAVDTDGQLGSPEDQELYRISSVAGVWQRAVRLTSNTVRDAAPALVSTDTGVYCFWKSGEKIVFSSLSSWTPQPIYQDSSNADQAQSVVAVAWRDKVALILSTFVSGSSDMFACLFDPVTGRWSRPRQLTSDENIESGISARYDGHRIAIAFLKSQLIRTNTEVNVNGAVVTLKDIQQLGRTDLATLSFAPGVDLALVPGSILFDQPNPEPGTNVILSAIIENRGEEEVNGASVEFTDATTGQTIGSVVISGPINGGERRSASLTWASPLSNISKKVIARVKAPSGVFDRDSANDSDETLIHLPDISLSAVGATEFSPGHFLLSARVINSGVVPAGPATLVWRLGSEDGDEIGRQNLGALAVGQTMDVLTSWSASSHIFTNRWVKVIGVVTSSTDDNDFDDSNNVKSQMVNVIPSWTPQITSVRLLPGGGLSIEVQANNVDLSELTVESAPAITGAIMWAPERIAVQASKPGLFEISPTSNETKRFYRVRVNFLGP